MNTFPLISIVIPTYNNAANLREVIESVEKINYSPFEVIVVNDNSKDNTLEILGELSSEFNNITVISNKSNLGPAASRNAGIRKAAGKYVAFVETDMRVDADWMKHAVEKLEGQPADVVSPKAFDLKKKDKVNSIGIHIVPHTGWVVSIGFGKDRNDNLDYQIPVSVGAVGTVFRKEALEAIHGFDEKLVHNIDDIDLGWRLWMAGYRVVYVPSAVVYHEAAKNPSERSKVTTTFRSEFHSHKMPRVFIKNYEIKNLIRYLPALFVIHFIRDLSHLLKGNTTPMKAGLKSCAWLMKNFADTLRERKSVQSTRKVSDDKIMSSIMVRGSFFSIYKEHIAASLATAREW
jgi:GT2 family glycosyltransferase